jgi:CubicO group peptidase (beta-lactamase class C family)
MLRKLLHTVACSLVLSLAFARPTLAEDLAERMDRIVQTYVDSREFMGAVLVAEGDKVIFNKAYGSANLEWKIPNTTSTKFRIGSVTKQFTAVAALLLEERGKLRIDEPV